MVHSSPTSANHPVGLVEEVVWDVKTGGTALSVPLFSGSQTVGVLLVSPNPPPPPHPSHDNKQQGTTTTIIWTEADRQIVAKTAQSLSLALSMDSERTWYRDQHQNLHAALSDSLHQFKNPLQALRTYGKLLQRQILATSPDASTTTTTNTPQILELAEHLMVQSDRLVERLKPVDAIVDSLSEKQTPPPPQWLALNPAQSKEYTSALVPFRTPSLLPPVSSQSSQPPERAITFPTTTSTTTMNERSPLWLPVSTRKSSPHAVENGMTDSSSHHTANTPSSSPSSTTLVDDMELEMSFVMDVLEPILEAFRVIAVDQGIQFDIIVETAEDDDDDELPGVMVHPQALQEVVTNLLDNAFRYVFLRPSDDSRARFQPHVRIRFLPNHHYPTIGAGVTILVEDNGLGIPVEDRESVFERGVRRAANFTDGSGIGLDIARSLTHHMGGTLRIVENQNNPYQPCLEGAILELVLFRQPPRISSAAKTSASRNTYASM
jgi:signal transduction histidine kinase